MRLCFVLCQSWRQKHASVHTTWDFIDSYSPTVLSSRYKSVRPTVDVCEDFSHYLFGHLLSRLFKRKFGSCFLSFDQTGQDVPLPHHWQKKVKIVPLTPKKIRLVHRLLCLDKLSTAEDSFTDRYLLIHRMKIFFPLYNYFTLFFTVGHSRTNYISILKAVL